MVNNPLVSLKGRQIVLFLMERLEQAGIDQEQVEFEVYQLIQIALGKANPYLETLTAEQADALWQLCDKRCDRVPLQYLAGKWDFMDFELQIGEGVLIPREDTYTLCLAAADVARQMGANADHSIATLLGGWPKAEGISQPKTALPITVLDLCAGTGCVGLGILRMVPSITLLAVEKSPEAFVYLQKNTHNSKVMPLQADVFGFEKQLLPQSVSILAANPPYISYKEQSQLSPEVNYEPEMALYAQQEGLEFYQYFADNYRFALKKGGWFVFEIGASQGKAVQKILQQAGADFVQCLQDEAGRDRVVRARFLHEKIKLSN